jgi:hypothetical protein
MKTFTEQDLDALQEFLDSGGDEEEAKRLIALFDIEAVGEFREGRKFKWAIFDDIPDPNDADEVEDGLFSLRGYVGKRVFATDASGNVFVDRPEDILDGYNLEASDYIDSPDEFEGFWESPSPLYHATDVDNVRSILRSGLNPESQSRGLRNRGVGLAVFTTLDEESARSGMYGDAVFEIDTRAMARDGYTPEVEGEPDVAEYEAKNSLAWAFGVEGYTQDEPENDPDTVIVHGRIPPKYLRLLDR